MVQESQETSRAIFQIFRHHYDVLQLWNLVFPYKDISPITYFDESQWFDRSADYTYVGNVRLYAKSVFTRESDLVFVSYHSATTLWFILRFRRNRIKWHDSGSFLSVESNCQKEFESIRPRKLLVASVSLAVQSMTSASKRPQPRKTDILKVFQEGNEAPIIARLSWPVYPIPKKQGNSGVLPAGFRSW